MPATVTSMKKNAEVRLASLADVECRADGDVLRFTGYAAVFDALSDDLGGFREKIDPGAFAKTLADSPDVRALFNHNTDVVLGRTKNGTLNIIEDARGLRVEATLPNTQAARDVHELLKRGDVDQMSFAFTTVKDEWDNATYPVTRTLKEVRLHDVSIVTVPAYPQTTAEARSMADELNLEAKTQAALASVEASIAELREGKVFSRKNREQIQAAIDALSSLLASAEPEPATTQEENAAPEPEHATTQPRLSVLERELALIELEGVA